MKFVGKLLGHVFLIYPMIASVFLGIFTALRTNYLMKFNDFFLAFKRPYFPRLICWGILMYCLKTGLYKLFFLPGLWFCTTTIFALPLYLEHGHLRSCKSIIYSIKLVHHHFCQILGMLVMLALLQVVGFLCLGVGLFVTMPVALVTISLAYQQIVGINGMPLLVPQQSQQVVVLQQ